MIKTNLKGDKMDEKQFKQLLKTLKDIDSKLSILISLHKSTIKQPKIGEEAKSILKLCNGKNSVEDMITITKKKRNTIEVSLSSLRKKGLIRSTNFKNKTVYVKI